MDTSIDRRMTQYGGLGRYGAPWFIGRRDSSSVMPMLQSFIRGLPLSRPLRATPPLESTGKTCQPARHIAYDPKRERKQMAEGPRRRFRALAILQNPSGVAAVDGTPGWMRNGAIISRTSVDPVKRIILWHRDSERRTDPPFMARIRAREEFLKDHWEKLRSFVFFFFFFFYPL